MNWWPHLELDRGGRSMAGVAAAIPVLPWSEDTSLIDLLTSLEAEGKSLNSLATSLTPGSHQVSSGIDIQTLSIRGINRYEESKLYFFFGLLMALCIWKVRIFWYSTKNVVKYTLSSMLFGKTIWQQKHASQAPVCLRPNQNTVDSLTKYHNFLGQWCVRHKRWLESMPK